MDEGQLLLLWPGEVRRKREGDFGRIDGPANESGAEIRIKIPFLCCFLSEIRVFVRSETEP